jgi:hypothetical protein
MRALAWLTLGTLLFAGQAATEHPLSKAQGDRFHAKLSRIVETGNLPKSKAKPRAPVSTPFTDAELNSYLRFNLKDQIPPGVLDPSINALGAGRVSGRATVDLDAVRKQKQRGWLDPMGYLSGRLPIFVRGRLHTQDGMGRFQLESAEVNGITVPKVFVQELLSFYSRTPEDPDGINMDDPFELPAQIREIKVGQGSATIVQ